MDKYKKQLKDSFIDKLNEKREEGCREYSQRITKEVKEKFNLVKQALNNEIESERNKIKALEKDKKDSAEERENKMSMLKELEQQLDEILKEFEIIRASIE